MSIVNTISSIVRSRHNPDTNASPSNQDEDGEEVQSRAEDAGADVNGAPDKEDAGEEEEESPVGELGTQLLALAVKPTPNSNHVDITALISGASGSQTKRMVVEAPLTLAKFVELITDVESW